MLTKEQIEQCYDVFEQVCKMRNDRTYSQKEIAEQLRIPVKAVQWCTKHSGEWHTLKNHPRPAIFFEDDFEELYKLL